MSKCFKPKVTEEFSSQNFVIDSQTGGQTDVRGKQYVSQPFGGDVMNQRFTMLAKNRGQRSQAEAYYQTRGS